MREQSIVGNYYRLAPKKRLDVIVLHYDGFPAMMKDYENELQDWILISRARARQEALGDLGVRVQTGKANVSVTENSAFENIKVEEIMKAGKLDDSCRCLPDYDEISHGLSELKLMKREYELLKIKLHTLFPREREVFECYIRRQKRTADLAQELHMTENSVKSKMCLIKKKLYAGLVERLDTYTDETIVLWGLM